MGWGPPLGGLVPATAGGPGAGCSLTPRHGASSSAALGPEHVLTVPGLRHPSPPPRESPPARRGERPAVPQAGEALWL